MFRVVLITFHACYFVEVFKLPDKYTKRIQIWLSPSEFAKFDSAVSLYSGTGLTDEIVEHARISPHVRLAIKEWSDRILSGQGSLSSDPVSHEVPSSSEFCSVCPCADIFSLSRADVEFLRDNLRFVHNMGLHDFTQSIAVLDLLLDPDHST